MYDNELEIGKKSMRRCLVFFMKLQLFNIQ